MSAARVGEQSAVECMHVYRRPLLATRSNAGVGITPPKVPGAPNPTSSVMISRMLGACLGGTTRGAHHALDCSALSLITPPNFGSGAGSCFPLIVVVAPGEPGVPVVWISARAEGAIAITATASIPPTMICCADFIGADVVGDSPIAVKESKSATQRCELPNIGTQGGRTCRKASHTRAD